jgi:LysR family transcriptional regulator, nitrogen assimilation regulatory protein
VAGKEQEETGDFDAALLGDPKQSPAIQTEPIVEETPWVVGLPSAKLKRNRPVPIASLGGTPLILPRAQHAPAPWRRSN